MREIEGTSMVHCNNVWFVTNGDILMRCPHDISCVLVVVRFRYEISCLLPLLPQTRSFQNSRGVVVGGECMKV